MNRLNGDDVLAISIACDAISSLNRRNTLTCASPSMASTTLATYPQPLATVSYSRQNHLNHNHSISIGGAFDDLDLDDLDSVNTRANPEMSFSMSQGSQGSNLMMQTGGPFRQYEGNSTHNRTGSAPQIYSVSPISVKSNTPPLTLAGYIFRS